MDYKIIRQDTIRYIVVPKLTQLGLVHCFTTIDMDMGMKTNPSTDNIEHNFRLIYQALGINPKGLFGGIQTHSKNVETIIDINQGQANQLGRFFPQTDGLVTNLKGIALFTTYADCTPIILFDPVKKVHGNVHSGWKGTLQKIGGQAVEKMNQNYSCNLADIMAIIGPSIGKDDFEVELDVMKQFQDTFDFHKDIIKKKNDIKYLIDIQETNKRILLESGIKEENISVIGLSTKSNPMFHSYRRDGNKFGLMGCITCL